ncbi:hypothetical protein C3941_09265 [Kaistia algarum]|uniref:helix-turn-helix domain-containing protein n=1 Tax=Kaistia algarum TaxID=2083279 RepID=UPI000CE88607|nr:helix-turn-helix domain-containing protein [Kaistia algarum]MCX5512248.1 hypothetical protein [Kaistia algarum]PPE80341.1 hypothetical protein C3941_09265 [Kaistia algarum]
MNLPLVHVERPAAEPPRKIGVNRAALFARLASGSKSPRRALAALMRLGALDRPRRARVIPIRAVPGSQISAAEIIAEIASGLGLTVNDILSRSRGRTLSQARHEAMYEVARRTRLSLPTIGRAFGDRHHATVVAAVRRHAARNHLPPARGLSPRKI